MPVDGFVGERWTWICIGLCDLGAHGSQVVDSKRVLRRWRRLVLGAGDGALGQCSFIFGRMIAFTWPIAIRAMPFTQPWIDNRCMR
jgi:hypothetical protein